MKKFLFNIFSISLLIVIFSGINIDANAASMHSRVETSIKWAIDTANDNKHGYSQARRNGPDYDCSSFVSTAFKIGGFNVSGSLTTSTMSTPFMRAGFKKYKKGTVTIQRGDILLKPGSHVELYLGDDICVGAHSNYDKVTGDSGGKEIAVRKIDKCSFCRNKGYTYILRCPEYRISYDANGGSIQEQEVIFLNRNEQIIIYNNYFFKEGYVCTGWNIKRNTDNKWLIDDIGWVEEDLIKPEHKKTFFNNYSKFTLTDDFIDVQCDYGSYTFYAVWEEGKPLRGDVNSNNKLDIYDAIYLLYHVNFSESYPVNQRVDYDGNDIEDIEDAIYLLFHINFPERYPLNLD